MSGNANIAASASKTMKDEDCGPGEEISEESDERDNSDTKTTTQSPSQLKVIEELFIAEAEQGDIQSMEEALANKDLFNINATDIKGRTALRIAIENGHIGITDMLLKHGVEIGDCLLYAVNYEFYKAVELLLNHWKELEKLIKDDCSSTNEEEMLINKCASKDNGDFHPDISPLVLACHHNNLDIVRLLDHHGAQKIEVDYTKTLERSLGNYHKNKALASEAYIALGALRDDKFHKFVDPIDGAFKMCIKMRKRSVIEHEFRKEYLEIAMKCEQFAADLLGLTRDSEEVKTILTYDPEKKENTDSPKMVSTALSKGQKQFVAHPHCQQFLIEKWYQDFHEWRQGSLLKKLTMSILIGLLFPIFSIIYLMSEIPLLCPRPENQDKKPNPYGVFGKFMRRPYVKFLMHTSSYMTFMLLLFLNSQDYSDADTNRKYKNGEIPFLPLEYVVLIWVLAMTWREIKEFQSLGYRSYLTDPWNLVDFIQLSSYWIWFGLRIAGFIDVSLKNPTKE
ncbi:short transient receptor potential channel 4-like [Ptychodera flava]|uniref:short transient receptor potential channel 4-like n=1 Tax=Ptychodera flava TaxID=63121 RepID=UPI00396A1921